MHTVADLYAEVLGVLAQSKYVEKTELLIYVWISLSLLAVKSPFPALLGFEWRVTGLHAFLSKRLEL